MMTEQDIQRIEKAKEILIKNCPGFDPLMRDDTTNQFMGRVLKAMDEFASHYAKIKVDEQRDLMSKHLNIRNVPKPKFDA